MKTGIMFLVFLIITAILGAIYFVLKRWSNKVLLKFESYVSILWYNLKLWFKSKWKKFKLAIDIVRNIPDDSPSFLVEKVFHSFVSFYEKNKDEAEKKWKLPEDMFPNGVKDLANMYRWIKKLRHLNREEFNRIHCDFVNGSFEYWGAEYQTLSWRVNKLGELFIVGMPFFVPDDETKKEYEKRIKKFNKKHMKLENKLFDMDTEKCQWIIERRKYLNY